jgi:hypothetical protein
MNELIKALERIEKIAINYGGYRECGYCLSEIQFIAGRALREYNNETDTALEAIALAESVHLHVAEAVEILEAE